MSLWTTPAGRVAHPFDDIHAPSFRDLLRKLREADPDSARLRELIAAERAEADRPLSRPLTASALHTPIGVQS